MSVPRGTPARRDAGVQAKLDVFTDLLRRWNKTVNLTSHGDLPHVETRHIDDALQLLTLLPAGISHGIDLGSGAGFPGLILSLAANIPFTLIEADQRKCAFLREAARVTCAAVDVRAVRMESVTDIQAPLVTARGLAGLSKLVPILSRLLSPGGLALLPRGAGQAAELASLTGWSMTVRNHVSRARAGSRVLELRDILRNG